MASIREKKQNQKTISYQFTCCLGRDASGKQIRRYSTWIAPENMTENKARKAAQKAADKWEREERIAYEKALEYPECVKSKEVTPIKTDFIAFAKQDWFAICIDDGEHKPKTIAFYADTMKNIVAYFAGKTLQNMTATDVQKFLIYLRTEKHFSPQNVHHHHRTLNMIFNFAVKQDLVQKNPMDNVDKPLKINHIDRIITMDRTFAKNAENTRSEEYAHLQSVRRDYPNYTVTRREIKKNPNKESWKGLTYEYMENYISTHEEGETRIAVLKEFAEKRLISKCHSECHRYPTIKKWFLGKYPEVAEFGMPAPNAVDNKVVDLLPQNAEDDAA